jgi:hypothetical protein
MLKMEIQDAVKRAEYRNWQQVYVVLHGTALNIYQVKKDRGWWSNKSQNGPSVSPDCPPWITAGKLENSYGLLHADAGIAADYRKRKHVIRVRAETDQFLLSCVELPTFIKWLDHLYASINIAPPIDERDFPRDQSIPRMQRIRWLRAQYPRVGDTSRRYQRLDARRPSMASSTNDAEEEEDADGGDNAIQEVDEGAGPGRSRIEGQPSAAAGRLSVTSYPNENIDPATRKWVPKHPWTEKHDQLYAKLCFSVLLFKSPRKSNFVVAKGTLWEVNWQSGFKKSLSPPPYEQQTPVQPIEPLGPWQSYMPTHTRI